ITLGVVTNLFEDLSLSVDYWNIKIEDMISTEDPDNVYRQCLSPISNPSYDPAHPSCQQINRTPAYGAEGNTSLLYTNEGAVDFAGYDVALNWSTELLAGDFNLNAQLTIADKMKTRVNPALPYNDWKGTSGPSDIIGVNAYAYDWRTFIT